MDKRKEFEQKMEQVVSEKTKAVKKIKKWLKEYDRLNMEEERLSDEEFIRTGSCSFKLGISLKVTEDDLIRQLVKDVEGKTIKVDKPNLN